MSAVGLTADKVLSMREELGRLFMACPLGLGMTWPQVTFL